jgi:hypothetical protein
LAQNYNFSFGAFPTQSTQRSFCSELVAKVYEMLELPLFDKPPRKIWPVDLQHLLATPDWEDVTNLYQSKAVGKLLASEDQRKETEYMRVQSENLRIQMTTHVQEYKAIKALLAAGGRLDEMLGLPKKGTAGKLPIDLPIKFWDTPPIE